VNACALEISIEQVKTAEIGVPEIGAAKVRVPEVCFLEVYSPEIRVLQVGGLLLGLLIEFLDLAVNEQRPKLRATNQSHDQ
jgi:hypothetical protein